MSDVPVWIQTLQALATPAIALGGGMIAYRQWRTAHEKVVLDLFERRFQVFLMVREIASRGGVRKQFSDPGLPNEMVTRGRFLFGSEVNEVLHKIFTQCAEVDVGRAEAPEEIFRAFEDLILLMEPYMGMTQKRVGLGEWLDERNRRRLSYADDKQRGEARLK